MSRSTIVLAENHPQVAAQLRRLLESAFDVVAVVSHGEALLRASVRLRPDIVVTGLSMPGMGGLKAAAELNDQQPSVGIVFVAVHDDPALARKALRVGLGYVLTASAGEELVDAVHAALSKKHFVSAALGPIDVLLAG